MLDFWIAFEAFHKALCLPAFSPKIEPVHIAVREPQRAVVGVVVIFALRLFHGVRTGETFSARPDDGVIKDVRSGSEMVGGEEFTIDGHHDTVGFRFDLNVGSRDGGEG